MPKISVIITTHNRPHLLRRAVESVLRSDDDVEVIIVDDASSDETAEVCRGLSGVRYLRAERNQGVAGARNLGILASKGEFISFLDDDDVRLQCSLNRQAEILESNADAGLVYGQALFGDQDCTPTGGFYPERCPQGDIFWQLLEHNFIPCGAVLFRRSCLYRVGLLDKSIHGVDDWDLWIRIAELHPVAAIDQPVIVWRRPTLTSNQGSSRTVPLIALCARLMRERWLQLPRSFSASPRERREAWRRFSDNVAEHLLAETLSAAVRGEFLYARKSARTALRLDPSSLLTVIRRWGRASTLRLALKDAVAREGLAEIRAHLKQVRTMQNMK